MKSEIIMCITRDTINKLALCKPIHDGVISNINIKEFAALFTPDNIAFLPRRIAEQSCYMEDFIQLIPYVVFRDNADDTVLSYYRTSKAGEERLHNLTSIGFGGHISLLEYDSLINIFTFGTIVEIREELGYHTMSSIELKTITPTCIINSNATDVDFVHLGIVYILKGTRLKAHLKQNRRYDCTEDGLDKYTWRKISELSSSSSAIELESWSRLLINHNPQLTIQEECTTSQ